MLARSVHGLLHGRNDSSYVLLYAGHDASCLRVIDMELL